VDADSLIVGDANEIERPIFEEWALDATATSINPDSKQNRLLHHLAASRN
jgi:hypothetical protein